jgi:hypothetical protein
MNENAHRGKRPDGQITAAPMRSPACLSSPFRKNILIVRKFGLSYIRSCPAPPKGAYHDRRETRGGMWWTLEAPKTRAFFSGRRNRVVLSPRRWCQVLEKRKLLRGDGGQKARSTGESAVYAVKTIAWEMPGDSGVTC